MSPDSENPPTSAQASAARIGARDYLGVGLALSAFGALLVAATRGASGPRPEAHSLIAPMLGMVGLTAVVWLIMVVVRNATILRGITSPVYYVAYQSKQPPDWVERPARTFNNLMQVPVLFYVASLLMLITGAYDHSAVLLAWIFVGVRAVHALIYIGWNYVPYRFCAWICGCITLGVIWFRFALQVL